MKSPELYAVSLLDAPSETRDNGAKDKGKKRTAEQREQALKNALEQKEKQVRPCARAYGRALRTRARSETCERRAHARLALATD